MRIHIYCLLFFFLLGASRLGAQNLNTPAELLAILDSSELNYVLEVIETPVAENRPEQRVAHGFYIADEELLMYDYPDGQMERFKQAEAAFSKGEYEQAREVYLELHEKQPRNSQLLTYIGQTYEMEKDRKNAIKWLEKAVEANPLDYMAHWFLADNYLERYKGRKLRKRKKKILRHIQEAHLLNRNNPNILQSMERISRVFKMDWEDWHFTPQVKLAVNEDTTEVQLKTHEDWMGYALSMAAFLFEPGYQENMLQGTSGYAQMSAPFKEALVGLYFGLSEKEDVEDPQLRTVKAAVEGEMLDAFIIYEILLPSDPMFIYKINGEGVDVVREYLVEYRMRG